MNINSERFREGSFSKGGIIGAILGALASLATHKSGDPALKKAGKTGLLAALGYLLGDLFERKAGRR